MVRGSLFTHTPHVPDKTDKVGGVESVYQQISQDLPIHPSLHLLSSVAENFQTYLLPLPLFPVSRQMNRAKARLYLTLMYVFGASQ